MVEIQLIGQMVNKAGPLLQDFLAVPFNAGQYEKDFVPYKWRQGLYNGRLVAFPWDIAPVGLFYRRSIFQERGFERKARGHVRKPDDVGRLYRGRPQNLPGSRQRGRRAGAVYHRRCPGVLVSVIEQVGVPIIDEENVVHVDDPRFIEAVQIGRTIRELDLDGIARINYKWSDQWYSSFSSAQTATELAGSWFHGTLAEIAPDTAGDWA